MMIVAFVYALGIMMLLADGAPEHNETEADLETAFLDEPSSIPDSLEPCRGKREQDESCTGLLLEKLLNYYVLMKMF